MGIPRIVTPTADQLVGTIVMSILAIPRIGIKGFQSIVVFPGVGGPGRIFDAVEYMRTRPGTMRDFIVPGINPQEAKQNNFEILTRERLLRHPYNLSEYMGSIRVQGETEHTLSQAEWLAEVFVEEGVSRSIIMAAPFHLPRAFLTLLTALKRADHFATALIPLPGCVSPMRLLTEFGGTPWQLFAGEMARIAEYQRKGDLLSNEEIIEYFTWLYAEETNLYPA